MESKTELLLELLAGLKSQMERLEKRISKVEETVASLRASVSAPAVVSMPSAPVEPVIRAGEAIARLRNSGKWSEHKSLREQFLDEK